MNFQIEYNRSKAVRVRNVLDHFVKPITNEQYQSLLDNELIFESCTLEDIENTLFLGVNAVQDMMLEAISARAVVLKNKMNQFGKALNKVTSTVGITVNPEVEISKPRKSGNVAVMTTRMSLSDGQAVSVVFHAPDNDPLKINPSDTMIAFRFLLNSRDVTHVVAPVGGQDLSLSQATMVLSNLIEKNSEKFKSKQGEKVSQQKEIEDSQRQAVEIESQLASISDDISGIDSSIESSNKTIATLQKRIDRENDIQAKLRKEIEGLTPPAATTTVDIPNAGGNGEQPISSVGSRVSNMLDEATQKITDQLSNIENAEPSKRKNLVKLANSMFGTGIAPKKGEGVKGQSNRIAKLVQSSLSLQGKSESDFDQQFKNVKEIKMFMDSLGLKYKNNATRGQLFGAIMAHANAIKSVTQERLTTAVSMNDVHRLVSENKPVPVDDLRKLGITSTVYQLGDMALADVKNLEEVPPLDEQGLEFGQVRAYSEMIDNKDTGPLFSPLSNDELIKLDMRLQEIQMDMGLTVPVISLLSKTINNKDVVYAISKATGTDWIKSAVVNEITKRGLLDSRFDVDSVASTNAWRRVRDSESRFKSTTFTDSRGNKDFNRQVIVDTEGTNFRAGATVPTSDYKIVEIVNIPDNLKGIERMDYMVEHVTAKVKRLNEQSYDTAIDQYFADIENGTLDQSPLEEKVISKIKRIDPTMAIAASKKLIDLGIKKAKVEDLDYWYEMAGQKIKSYGGDQSKADDKEIEAIIRKLKDLIKDATPDQVDALRDYVNKQNEYFGLNFSSEQESLFSTNSTPTNNQTSKKVGDVIAIGGDQYEITEIRNANSVMIKEIPNGAIVNVSSYELTDFGITVAGVNDAETLVRKEQATQDAKLAQEQVESQDSQIRDSAFNRLESISKSTIDYVKQHSSFRKLNNKDHVFTFYDQNNSTFNPNVNLESNSGFTVLPAEIFFDKNTGQYYFGNDADIVKGLGIFDRPKYSLLQAKKIAYQLAAEYLKNEGYKLGDNNQQQSPPAVSRDEKAIKSAINKAVRAIATSNKASKEHSKAEESLNKRSHQIYNDYGDVIDQKLHKSYMGRVDAASAKMNKAGNKINSSYTEFRDAGGSNDEWDQLLDGKGALSDGYNGEELDSYTGYLSPAEIAANEAERLAIKQRRDEKQAQDAIRRKAEEPAMSKKRQVRKLISGSIDSYVRGLGVDNRVSTSNSDKITYTKDSNDEVISGVKQISLEESDYRFDAYLYVTANANGEITSVTVEDDDAGIALHEVDNYQSLTMTKLTDHLLSFVSNQATSPIDSSVEALNDLLANGANLNSTDYMAKMEIAFMAIDEAGKVEEYNDLMMDVSRQLDGIIDAESKR